jgi:hypothetical protein
LTCRKALPHRLRKQMRVAHLDRGKLSGHAT